MTTNRPRFTTHDAVRFFGTKLALAEAMDISQQAVSKWGDIPPADRREQIVTLVGLTVLTERPFPYGDELIVLNAYRNTTARGRDAILRMALALNGARPE